MKIEGIDVKDANHKIVLNITKDDVKAGSLKKANSCAAAKALCRQEGCEAAKVHMSRAYIKKGGKWLRFGVPMALRNEVLAFDRGGKFEPGEYTLVPLQPTVRLGADRRHVYEKAARKAKDRRKNHASQGKLKKAYHVVSGVRARMVDEWWK